MTAGAGPATLGAMDAAPRPPARPGLVITNHDPAFLELLRALLADEGYEALVPPKLEEPYPFITAQRPAAVVLDVPFRRETETLAMLDKLRLDPATAATPVVVCTTSPGALDGLARREGEGLYVLAKPFDLDRLLAVLATALRPPRGRAGRAG
jgi:DNA-binding response OmpR family regulator